MDEPSPAGCEGGRGGSDCDLLVLPEERPRRADVLEDPVALVVLGLISHGQHGAGAAGLPSLVHHLPEVQLLHLGQRKKVRRMLSEEGALWASPTQELGQGGGHTAEHRRPGPARTARLTPQAPPGMKEQPQELLPAGILRCKDRLGDVPAHPQ